MVGNGKRVLLLTLALAVAGTAAVFADDIYETIKAKKVAVTVNGTSFAGQALEVNGSIMVPLDAVQEESRMIVKRDGNEVKIYRPNVHLAFVNNLQDLRVGGILENVKGGDTYKLNVLTQVDDLTVNITNMRFEILDPADTMVHYAIFPIRDGAKGTFWFNAPINIKFEDAGDYTVKAYMQLEERGDYYLVAEKVLQVKS